MLGKLLKYDLKWIYKLVGIFYILAFIFSVISKYFGKIENSLIFNIVSKISFGFAISMIITSLVKSLMRSWDRLIKNVYKDESYLTHTLPVKKREIFLSKVISGLVCVFTTIIVAIVCLFICYYSDTNMEILKGMLEVFTTTYNTSVLKFLLLVLITIFIEMVFILLTGYVGIILGHKSNKNKMVRSIVIGYVLYLIFQALTLGLIVIYGLFNSEIMNLINTIDTINIEAIKSIMYVVTGMYVVYSIILYLLGQRHLKKGINVE